MDNYLFLWHVFCSQLDGLPGVFARYADWVCCAGVDARDICVGDCVSHWVEYDKGLWYIWNYKCYINIPGHLFL